MAGLTKATAPFAMVLALSAPAWGQAVGASCLSASAPQPSRTTAAKTNGSRANATALSHWLCAGGVEMDIRPVSSDDAASNEWVVVYRRNGVAYSAERIDRKTAQAFPVTACTKSQMVG